MNANNNGIHNNTVTIAMMTKEFHRWTEFISLEEEEESSSHSYFVQPKGEKKLSIGKLVFQSCHRYSYQTCIMKFQTCIILTEIPVVSKHATKTNANYLQEQHMLSVAEMAK